MPVSNRCAFSSAGQAAKPALVVFTDCRSLRLLRCLKPGFRHCFLTVRCGDQWVVYDPLSNRTVVSLLPDLEQEVLAGWYRAFGCEVVPTTTNPRVLNKVWWGPYTCVEAVKRILGLRNPAIMTPWQLYKHISKSERSGQ